MLVLGIVGTHWLSGLTANGPGRLAGWPHASSAPAAARPRPADPPLPRASVRRPTPIDEAPEPEPVRRAYRLLPLGTPPVPTPYARLRGHLDGSLVLRVTVDRRGLVRGVAVDRSSGDAVLDAHALATVRGWRFAVPADAPEQFTGRLPMHFSSNPAPTRLP